MYTHIKFYGTDILPPDEIRGRLYIHWLRVFFKSYIGPQGQVIEGLKHFTVSDVKFHPKMYALGVWWFSLANIL